jgi:hypothetical protein
MDAHVFQVICTVVLLATFGLMLMVATPRAARAAFLADALVIAVGAWLAEETSILRYAYYFYGDVWWVMADEVPVLVVLIWSVVVLSSRAVVRHLFPGLGGWRLALGVGLAVTVDASLIETVAVDARLTLGGVLAPEPRLWWWSEEGYLGVPLIGMLGWGAYAAAITAALGWARGGPGEASARPTPGVGGRLALAPLLALAGTHALLVAMWWGGLRFFLRGPLPEASLAVGVAAGLALAGLVLARRREVGGLPPRVAVPRMMAAAVFFVLLGFSPRAEPWPLWVHLGAVALPYLALTDWRGLLWPRAAQSR